MEVIKLNIIPQGVPPICHASQYDNKRVYRALLFDNFIPFKLDGTETLTLEVRKPDDTIITADIPNTSDNYIDFNNSEQMTAVAGVNQCKIRIEKNDEDIGTLLFYMEVQKDVLSNGIPSESEIHDLQERIDKGLEDNELFNSKMDKNNPTGTGSLAVGYNASADGDNSVALGNKSFAFGNYSATIGYGVVAESNNQFVFGKWNKPDTDGEFVEIVGNGEIGARTSNARTLDWQGNETLAGDLVFNGNTSLTQTLAQINASLQALRQATGLNE